MLINGIIHVTGEPDTGKTTFALECGADPSRIWFLDQDVKGRATVQQLLDANIKFGRYTDLVALATGKRELDFHNACIEMIASEKPDKYDAIIWDTWTPFAKTCHPYVVTHPLEFRQQWSKMGTIKGGQQWQEAHRLEAQVLHRLQKLAPLVIVITHLKDDYLNNAKTGKEVPACSKTLIRVPQFRVWIRHNENSSVPIALILKRPSQKIMTDRGLRTVNILPRKIVPRGSDMSLWDTIQYYYDNPIGLREPAPEETPNEYELSILDGTLTPDQRHTLHLMLQAGAVSRDEVEVDLEPEVDSELVAAAKALKADGKPLPAVASELGLAVSEVARLLRS